MKSKSNIFQTTICLTNEQLLRYAKGEMNATEKRIVELHIADCEMCSDAVEGLMLMEQSNLKSLQTGVNEQIDALTVNRIAKIISIQRRWYLSAAAIALLMLGTYFTFKTIQKQQSQNTVSEQLSPVQKETSVELNSASTQAAETTVPTATVETKMENLQQVKTVAKIEGKKNKEEISLVAEDQDDAKKSEIAQVVTDEKDFKSLSEPVAAAIKKPLSKTNAETDSVVTDVHIASKEVTTQSVSGFAAQEQSLSRANYSLAPSSTTISTFSNEYKVVPFDNDLYSKAIELYNQKLYSQALQSFKQLLQQNPGHLECNYYSGMCNYLLNNFSKAAKQLDVATTNKATSFYESALWYKANAYVKLNDSKHAKRTLETVIKFNGIYKANAEELLKKLE